MPRRQSTTGNDADDSPLEQMMYVAATYPLVGCILGLVLLGIAVLLWRMGSLYPLFAAIVAMAGIFALIATGIGGVFRLIRPGFRALDLTKPAKSGATFAMPYRRKPELLSRGERAFFDVLHDVARNEHLVFAKVRLADLLEDLPEWLPQRKHWLDRICQKHVDFVLCHHHNSQPFLVIELDDRTHQHPDRRRRDEFVSQVLATAGIDFKPIPCQPAYDVADLAKLVKDAAVKNFP